MPHGHEAGWARQEIGLFVDGVLGRDSFPQALAAVSIPRVQGTKVRAAYNSPSAILKAELHWTTDLSKPWQQREWQTTRGEVLGLDAVEAQVPEARPLVYFLTITDSRGAVVSTEHAELTAGSTNPSGNR
jgi:hypothetical protein